MTNCLPLWQTGCEMEDGRLDSVANLQPTFRGWMHFYLTPCLLYLEVCVTISLSFSSPLWEFWFTSTTYNAWLLLPGGMFMTSKTNQILADFELYHLKFDLYAFEHLLAVKRHSEVWCGFEIHSKQNQIWWVLKLLSGAALQDMPVHCESALFI